jgi:hypothetical protein
VSDAENDAPVRSERWGRGSRAIAALEVPREWTDRVWRDDGRSDERGETLFFLSGLGQEGWRPVLLLTIMPGRGLDSNTLRIGRMPVTRFH